MNIATPELEICKNTNLPFNRRVLGGSGRSIPRHDSTKTQFSAFDFVSDSLAVPLPLSESWLFVSAHFSVSCKFLIRSTSFKTAVITSLTVVRRFRF